MRAGSSVALLVALTSHAVADPSAAEQAFQRGRQLMNAQRYPEACAAFEHSQHLDPQLGTLFNLANCDVEIGKLASAWKIYRNLAKSDPTPDRRALSSELAAKLEPRLPRLVVVVPAMPARLAIAIDTADATVPVGVQTPVDVGRHTVVVTAPGFTPHSDTIVVKEGELARLSVRLTSLDANAAAPAAARYSKIAIASGSTLVVAGLVVGTVAVSDWHAAQNAASAEQAVKSHHAVVLGDVSTALVVAGLIPAAIGVYLWRTSGSAAVVTSEAGADQAGVMIVGTF